MNLNKFVENVKIFCKEKGKSPTAVCVEAGLSRAFLTDITNKNTSPRIDSIFALSQYFGVSVSELLGEAAPDRGAENLHPRDRALLDAYHNATEEVQHIVDVALTPYMREKTASDAS